MPGGPVMGRPSAAGVFRCWLHLLHAPVSRDVVAAREQEYHGAHERHPERQLPPLHGGSPFVRLPERAVSFPHPQRVTPLKRRSRRWSLRSPFVRHGRCSPLAGAHPWPVLTPWLVFTLRPCGLA